MILLVKALLRNQVWEKSDLFYIDDLRRDAMHDLQSDATQIQVPSTWIQIQVAKNRSWRDYRQIRYFWPQRQLVYSNLQVGKNT